MSLPNWEKRYNEIQNKVDKVEGKGLSSNDFTDEYKDKIPTLSIGEITTYHGNFSTVDVNKYCRYGNVVVVDFRALISSNIPNNTEIIELPYQPAFNGTIMAGIGGRYDISQQVWMYYKRDSKALIIGNGATSAQNKYIHIHFTYMCQ